MAKRSNAPDRQWPAVLLTGLLGLGLQVQAADQGASPAEPLPRRTLGTATPLPTGTGKPASSGAGSALPWQAPLKPVPQVAGAAVAMTLPDPTSQPNVLVAGKHSTSWGKSLVLSDADAQSALNGTCQVTLAHEIRNAGAAPTGEFTRLWRNLTQKGALEHVTPSVPGGAVLARTDTLGLKPGLNNVVLYLDYFDQVKELNEGNNQRALSITLNGLCAGMPSESTARGGAAGLRWAPQAKAGPADPAPASRLLPPVSGPATPQR